MAVTITQVATFMEPVIEEAAEFMQLLDVAKGDPAVDDVVLKASARLAYSQFIGYTNRDFVLEAFTDLYYNISKKLEVRCTPLVSVEEVKYDETILVVDQDYRIDGNYLIFGGLSAASFLLGEDREVEHYLYGELKISYTGGLANAGLNYRLQSALVFQTVANYRRKGIIGLSKAILSGPTTGHSVDVSSDKGYIVEAARGILDKLIYYGDYEEC